MSKKVWLSGFMAICLLLLAACGSGGASKETESAPGTQNPTETVKGDPVKLNVAFLSVTGTPPDLKLVESEINKLTQAKINVTVNLIPINYGAYAQQVNLMLTSNEKLDLILVGSAFGYSSQVSRGQLLPLDKLLDENGPNIKKALDQAYLNAGKVDGKIYGITSIRDLASANGFTMRKDLADKHGIDASKIHTFDDVEAVLKIIKENEKGITPLIPSGAGFSFLSGYKWYDGLGNGLGVLPDYDNNLQLVNSYASPEYAELLKKMRSWYQAGYVLKDAATNKASQIELIKANRGFGYLSKLKPGFDAQESRSIGQEMISATLSEPVSMTDDVTNIMWGIPRQAEDPSASMKFLDLLYGDAEVVNLFDWGIENKHYVKVSDNVIKYPEGINMLNNGYNLNMGWLFGNQFLSYVFEGEDPEIWVKMKDFNDKAIKSKAMGFTMNPEAVKTEIAAVTNVMSQYYMVLETGSVDPDKVLPEYLNKLKTAGIDKVIAEKQKQLDEWAKTEGLK
ncbi:ABC transporter substrate-binding protein [Cohnella abietis]|uniref:ABC transporter substrate-binding protein n=1 Tax=Cohnella abietis TaxID=2507935 RepID=A0A3T1D9M3_9BACL|nr:ABC transporter substrate-binding protein [Cohnella abietis]BBI34801.1 ABC transporter substrate-binding protein [Cohnella abietis]